MTNKDIINTGITLALDDIEWNGLRDSRALLAIIEHHVMQKIRQSFYVGQVVFLYYNEKKYKNLVGSILHILRDYVEEDERDVIEDLYCEWLK